MGFVPYYISIVLCINFFVVLGMEPRALYMQTKCSISKQISTSSVYIYITI
jgi:hypothetical protein